MYLRFIFILLLLASCKDQDSREQRRRNQKAHYITRSSYDYTAIPPMVPAPRKSYPWEEKFGHLTKVTKEYFRCKGSSANPAFTKDGTRITDCSKHSLPLKDGKEFVYPILLDLLNYLQQKTGKRVVITSGHRCPEHNTYINGSPSSKHLIGAEVAFYVEGMEMEPGLVVRYLIDYYKDHPNPQMREFKRYEDTNTAIQPWLNKEIFIKLYAKTEGRDSDTNHSYPYISIQVRHDGTSPVNYTWNQAWNNYLRY